MMSKLLLISVIKKPIEVITGKFKYVHASLADPIGVGLRFIKPVYLPPIEGSFPFRRMHASAFAIPLHPNNRPGILQP